MSPGQIRSGRSFGSKSTSKLRETLDCLFDKVGSFSRCYLLGNRGRPTPQILRRAVVAGLWKWLTPMLMDKRQILTQLGEMGFAERLTTATRFSCSSGLQLRGGRDERTLSCRIVPVWAR